jgi:hypothetical protein
MRQAANNHDTWQPLSLATGRLLQSYENKNEQACSDSDGARRGEQSRKDHEDYVDQRLADLRAFELRYAEQVSRETVIWQRRASETKKKPMAEAMGVEPGAQGGPLTDRLN